MVKTGASRFKQLTRPTLQEESASLMTKPVRHRKNSFQAMNIITVQMQGLVDLDKSLSTAELYLDNEE